MNRIILALLAALLLPALAHAAKLRSWRHFQPAHFEKAHATGVVLSSEGTLQLGHTARPLGDIEAAHVWALAEDPQGRLLAATGNEGKVFRVSQDGATEAIYQSDDSQVLSLVVNADGVAFAGTGPTGQVIAIPPKGPAKVLARTGELYIWALTLDKEGNLLAATGPNGRILRIDAASGKVTTYYQTRQEHVLCLAVDHAGNVYAGTSSRGLVYRVDAKGKGFVLFEAPQAEVRVVRLTDGGEGLLWVGTGVPAGRKSPGVTTSTTSGGDVASGAGTASDRTAAAVTEPPAPLQTAAGQASKPAASAGNPKPTPVPAPTAPGEKENSVWLLYGDGRAVEVFRQKVMILGLAERGDQLLIASGGDGQLFRVHQKTRDRTELARIDHTHIHSLLVRRDGTVVLGAGDRGRIYTLDSKYVPKGTMVSEVLDAKLPARWGSVSWHAVLPAGTQVSFAARSGNVSTPDDTWSDWCSEQMDPDKARVECPPARFLQYRLTLATDRPAETPAVRNLTIRYQNGNVPPEVVSIDVPASETANTDGAKRIKIKWKAVDANEDALTYSIFVRKEGWPQWLEVASDLEKPEFDWDTATSPAGIYELKVVASDREDNPPAEALTGERVSVPFLVDHVPPTVTARAARQADGSWVIEVAASDLHSRIASASFAVDGGKWSNLFPVDGLFDARTRSFKITLSALPPGPHVIVVRASDAAGNVGSADVIVNAGPPR